MEPGFLQLAVAAVAPLARLQQHRVSKSCVHSTQQEVQRHFCSVTVKLETKDVGANRSQLGYMLDRLEDCASNNFSSMQVLKRGRTDGCRRDGWTQSSMAALTAAHSKPGLSTNNQ